MRSSLSPGSDGTMSNSPVRSARWSKPRKSSRARSSKTRKSSSYLLAPPESAAPTRPGSDGPSSNGPDSNGLDSLPSVEKVGGESALLHEGNQRQPENVQLLIEKKKSEVNLKRSLTLVEQSCGRSPSPLSRRSYTLVEQSGTTAWI